jgi:hypothetical protein
MSERDNIERRIVIEYGRRYVYLALTDGTTKILPGREEVFTQPFLLERKDSWEEADDCWQACYQHILDAVVFPLPLQGEAGDKPESTEDDSPPSG